MRCEVYFLLGTRTRKQVVTFLKLAEKHLILLSLLLRAVPKQDFLVARSFIFWALVVALFIRLRFRLFLFRLRQRKQLAPLKLLAPAYKYLSLFPYLQESLKL